MFRTYMGACGRMSEISKIEQTNTSRRSLLRLGAVAVPAFVTLKPAYAAQTSILNCQIPFNTAELSGKWIKDDGTVVAAGTGGAHGVPVSPRPYYTGEQIKTLTRPTGVTLSDGKQLKAQSFNAHVNYIKKLSYGKPGFTCYASIQTY